MTLESLRTMLDPTAAQQRATDERNRNRCPVREWSGGRISLGTGMNTFGKPVVKVTVTGANIISSRIPIDSGTFTFDLPLPAKDMQVDSEIGQTSLALQVIGVANLIDLDGATNTAAIEREHEYTGREWQDREDGQLVSTKTGAKGGFYDVPKRLTYYQFTAATIGGKQASNGTSQSGSGCDPAALAIANEYSLHHNDDEMRGGVKLIQALQQAGITFAGANLNLQAAAQTGTLREFLAQHYAEIPAPASVN